MLGDKGREMVKDIKKWGEVVYIWMDPIHFTCCPRPVRLIETCTFRYLEQILRSHNTFNRDSYKNP